MFDLNNIFDVFLPQLLLYPNPSSPLNPLAANLLMDSPQKYNEKVIDHVKKFCLKIENIKSNEKIQNSNSSTIEEEMSELSDASDISELSQTSDIELVEN